MLTYEASSRVTSQAAWISSPTSTACIASIKIVPMIALNTEGIILTGGASLHLTHTGCASSRRSQVVSLEASSTVG